MIRTIENERGRSRVTNDLAGGGQDASDPRSRLSEQLSMEELEEQLEKRVAMMRDGRGGDGIPDQARVAGHYNQL